MTTVADILKFVETIAPPYMKESWDRVGLNCGRLDREVKKVLVALCPSKDACAEAKEFGAQVLLTHHHLIWEPGFVTDVDQQGKNTFFLIENGIASINAHTNLDLAPGGVNDALANTLGLSDVQILNPVGTDAGGVPYGLIHTGTVPEQSLESFLADVKRKLGCKGLRYVPGSRPVHRVAVGGGACGGELQAVATSGCDTFITGDVKFNTFRDAFDLGLNLIDAGHFYTENPIVPVLAAKLQAAFPEIQVKISENHRDPMEFFC